MIELAEASKPGVPRRVDVEIFGEIYHMKTDDPEGLNKLVNIVDSAMKSVSRQTHSFAGSRVAVLAALTIAEDYLQLKKDYDELLKLIDQNH